MRFGRSRPTALAEPTGASVDRVVRRTSWGIALITLALIALLMTGVGVVTAAVALRTAEEQVDRTLKQAADVRLAALEVLAEELPTPTPTPTDTASPEETGNDDDNGGGDDNSGPGSDNSGSGSDNSGSGSDNSGSGSDDGGSGSDNSGSGSDNSGSGSDNSGSGSDNSGSGSDNSGKGNSDDDRTPKPTRTPRPTRTPTRTPAATPTTAEFPILPALATLAPSPSPTPAPSFGLSELDDRTPESAETFFILLSPDGAVLSNPQGRSLIGLPDQSAVSAAVASGEDWRTVTANGIRIRLLSQRVNDPLGNAAGVLQSGFVLTLQDRQNSQLLATIALASIAGLCGAALVTLLVTQRAMRPIRNAFAAERRFVASASHELRTPVAVVRASAEILQREGLVKPDGEKLVDDIISESDRSARLVSDMLALASAEAGAITVDPREIEMRAFVTELGRRAESIAAERGGIRIEVVQDGSGQAADRELVVSADPDRMTQLLLIFIDNAIDHSPPNGTVRLFVRPVSDGTRPQVAVGVADEGPGVPREERSRIFEPFAKVAGRRRTTGTTGLGLAIARILAARQDASLHVDDASGGGAVFSVWLPRLLAR